MKKAKKLTSPVTDLVGLVFPNCNRKIIPIENDEKLTTIRLFIFENFKKRNSFNYAHSSYGLKHLIERYLCTHIANGELIASMLMEGYMIKPIRSGGLNCHFNVSVPYSLYKFENFLNQNNISMDSYFKFWKLFIGYDFKDTKTGRTLTKGEFYRTQTEIANMLACGEIDLPARFELKARPPFVPIIERHGKKYEKPQPIENNNKKTIEYAI